MNRRNLLKSSAASLARGDLGRSVPDTPGLGVTLNDDEVKKHLKPGTGYFEPTPHWDDVQSWDDALFS